MHAVHDVPEEEVPSVSKEAGRASTPAACNVRMIDGRIDSGELFAETREIMIGHGNQIYRLRLTAQDKLILTK
jgi:hemin uptake protein HemP